MLRCCQICHGCIHIDSTHTVSYRFFLFINGSMALVILYILRNHSKMIPITLCGFLSKKSRIFPPLLKKISRLLFVGLISCCMIHAHQTYFNLLMPRYSGQLVRPESVYDVSRHAFHNLKQLILAGSLIICDSSLHHMTCTVQLMTLKQILPSVLRLFYCEICIQISIRLLCCGDNIYNVISSLFKRSIRLYYQRICHSLKPFCHVTVLKDHTVKLAL